MSLLDNYYVVDFHYIDDFRCTRPLKESLINPFYPEEEEDRDIQSEEQELRSELSEFFKEAGWEGDGEINCIFLAPCFFGSDDGWSEIIYHVKQSNNGTSWLAIPKHIDLSLPEGFLAKHRR